MSFYLLKFLYANDFYALQRYCFFLKLGAKNGLNLLKLGAKNKSNLLKLGAKNRLA